MTFTKRKIAEFKSKGRHYIFWRQNLKPLTIKETFYNGNEKRSLKLLFPDKNLDYCRCYMYDIVLGDYQLGLKYVNENGTYYMFWSSNSFWAPPQDVAIGKAVDGKIFLIREHVHNGEHHLNFRVIPEKYIDRENKGYRPKSYNHSIFVYPSCIEEVIECITDEDVKCIKIAYEGIRELNKLIEEI